MEEKTCQCQAGRRPSSRPQLGWQKFLNELFKSFGLFGVSYGREEGGGGGKRNGNEMPGFSCYPHNETVIRCRMFPARGVKTGTSGNRNLQYGDSEQSSVQARLPRQVFGEAPSATLRCAAVVTIHVPRQGGHGETLGPVSDASARN